MGDNKSHHVCVQEASWSPSRWIVTVCNVFDFASLVKNSQNPPLHGASYRQRGWDFIYTQL